MHKGKEKITDGIQSKVYYRRQIVFENNENEMFK